MCILVKGSILFLQVVCISQFIAKLSVLHSTQLENSGLVKLTSKFYISNHKTHRDICPDNNSKLHYLNF